jgi:hypothetical protein
LPEGFPLVFSIHWTWPIGGGKEMVRKAFITSLVFTFVVGICVAADPPNFSGHWQIDAAESKSESERTLALDLIQNGQHVTFTRLYEDAGKQVTSKLTCTVGGPDCEFVENGHKAKGSLWYDGPKLVILKTDGDKRDSTVEWQLQLVDGGKTLNVNREVMEPSDHIEKLVFTKTESSANGLS